MWGDRFVSESALTSGINAARRAVGDDGRAQRVVRTVHGRGYQFVAPVEGRDQAADRARPAVGPDLPEQEIRFCAASGGVRLAYATMGDGPPLVKAANWLSHLVHDRGVGIGPLPVGLALNYSDRRISAGRSWATRRPGQRARALTTRRAPGTTTATASQADGATLSSGTWAAM